MDQTILPERITQRAVGQGIYEIVHSPRQGALFVAATGGFGEGAGEPCILRLDPATLAVTATIHLPHKGFGLALDDAAGRLYVGHSLDAAITVIDAVQGTVKGTLRMAEKTLNAEGKDAYPHNFRELLPDPARNRLYAPGLALGGSALYVVDTETLAVEAVIEGFGYGAAGVALDSTGQLFVSNMEGEVITFDTAALRITDKTATGGDQLMNVALDGQRIFVTDQGHPGFVGMWAHSLPSYRPKGTGKQVLVLDAADRTEIARLPAGAGAVALLADAGRRRLYVTSRDACSVGIYDLDSYALLETVPAEGHPNSLALAGNALFVTVKNAAEAPASAQDSVLRIALED